MFVPLLRVFLFRYFFLYKKYISNKIDEFCNESGFLLKDYVCICLYLISVPLLPGSGAFPVLRSRWQVKMVFLWVSPILAPAWSTFFNELDFWIVQCPPTTSVLAAPWCLCSVADCRWSQSFQSLAGNAPYSQSLDPHHRHAVRSKVLQGHRGPSVGYTHHLHLPHTGSCGQLSL